MKTGVAILVVRSDGAILLLRRKGEIGRNTWGLPGGKIEEGEKSWDAAMRELREETGLEIGTLNFAYDDVSNFDLHLPCASVETDLGEHGIWRSIYFRCDLRSYGVPKIMEPTKHSELAWFTSHGLELAAKAGDLFAPLGNHLYDLGLTLGLHQLPKR